MVAEVISDLKSGSILKIFQKVATGSFFRAYSILRVEQESQSRTTCLKVQWNRDIVRNKGGVSHVL